MEQITISNSEEQVKIKITINFVGVSDYTYSTPSGQFPKKDKMDYEYPVGNGIERLKSGNKCDNWKINLLNQGKDELDYEYKIEWFQGGIPVHKWPADNVGKGKLKKNERLSKEGNSVYLEKQTL